MRILLIEDERELAEALSAALGKHGIVTDHTMHLADAVELTRQNLYDAILLDRRLPDGEGLSFIPELRRTGKDTPIIVLTARTNRRSGLKASTSGPTTISASRSWSRS